MSSIAILTTIGPTGVSFADFLRKIGESTASGKHTITWYCVMDKGMRVPTGFILLDSMKPGKSAPYNHARLVLKGFDKLKDIRPDYVIISDVDISLLAKDWDERIINELEYFDVVGVNVGSSLPPKRQQRFPIITFMAFKCDLLYNFAWDLCPQKISKKETDPLGDYIASDRDAKICNVPVGTRIKKDCGWKMPYIFTDNGYTNPFVFNESLIHSKKSQLLSLLSSKDKSRCYKICRKIPHHMGEYSFRNGDILCSHLYICRRGIFDSSISKIWRYSILKYLFSLGIEIA